MEFEIEKCAMLIMKSGKRETTERIKLINQEKHPTFWENGNYEYLGIFDSTIKQTEFKERVRMDYLRRTRKFHETKLYSIYLSNPSNGQGVTQGQF